MVIGVLRDGEKPTVGPVMLVLEAANSYFVRPVLDLSERGKPESPWWARWKPTVGVSKDVVETVVYYPK